MNEGHVIETIDLRKDYGGTPALSGLNLQVPRGSICGFLGRNGAGKTTTLKALLGMIHPTSGEARVFGLQANVPEASVEIRRRAAFVNEYKDLFDAMTVTEMVRFTQPFFPRWRKDLEQRYLRTFDLPSDRRVSELSKGMRTKLALLLALCRGAELLLLDEPTSGLDPTMAEEVLKAIVTHASDEGMSVLFSSHHLADVEQIADRIAIIDGGRIVVNGALDEVRERHHRVTLVFENEAPDIRFASAGVKRVRRAGRILTLIVDGQADAVIAEARALSPSSVDATPLTLKDIFLETVSRED